MFLGSGWLVGGYLWHLVSCMEQQSKNITIQIAGHGTIEAHQGERLVMVLHRANTGILHRCGGQARCTACRVTFQAGEPARMTKAEHDKLQQKGLLDEARLSCQIACTSDMMLAVVQTEENSGLQAGTIPSEEIEPVPEWVNRIDE